VHVSISTEQNFQVHGQNLGFNGNFKSNTEIRYTQQSMMPVDRTHYSYQQNQQRTQIPSNSISKPNGGGYKTKMCRHYELGKCKLSGLCNFAHGQEELNFHMANQGSQNNRESLTNAQPNKVPLNNSMNKIFKLEKSIEDFEIQQRNIISKLKHLVHNFGNSQNMTSDIVR
jgi:hypothetical protein